MFTRHIFYRLELFCVSYLGPALRKVGQRVYRASSRLVPKHYFVDKRTFSC
jgi:hypothetical protein